MSLVIYKLTVCPFGEFETYEYVVTLNGSADAVWQFIVSLVRLYSYPDDDGKRDGNMLVINNMQCCIIGARGGTAL
jgi:hypothetical protein